MTPDVVVDIGNSRIKWGWGQPMEMASLPADDPAAWDAQLPHLPASRNRRWAVASVHPARLDRFATWAAGRGDTVRVITHADIRLQMAVEEPGKVGIDRLLNAVAVREFFAEPVLDPRTPYVAIDIGTAMTMNVVRGEYFCGGVILPGPWMMARALHEFTAKLPHVEPRTVQTWEVIGTNTTTAIQSGIQAAILGAAVGFIRDLRENSDSRAPAVAITGGGHDLLQRLWGLAEVAALAVAPQLTLMGIRIAAEALP